MKLFWFSPIFLYWARPEDRPGLIKIAPRAMGRLLPFLLRHTPGSPLRRFHAAIGDPLGTQTRVLRSLLRRAQDTEWGRRYGFADLLGAPDITQAYRDRVPLHRYEDFRTDIERLRDGEANVLWPGRPDYFAVSSGTVSSGRIVPVFDDTLKTNWRFGLTLGLEYVARYGHLDMLAGSQLGLPSWIEPDRRPGVRIGQISAILAETTPKLLGRARKTMPDSITRIPDWREKMAALARHVVDRDVRMIVFAPSWGRALFSEVLAASSERSGSPAGSIGQVWPRLRLVVTGAVALSSYREMLEQAINLPQVDFLESYGASEGFVAFQTDLSDPAMQIHLDNGIFFEFVRQEALQEEHPRRHHIGEVEPGVRYAIVLTTNSGLWAYPLGDVVRFSQCNPHKLFVAGRTSEMLDKYGEATFGDDADQALRTACAATGAVVPYYHVTHTHVDAGDFLPAHEWIVEFEQEPDDLNRFIESIDRALQHAGHHYYDRRACLAFGPPQITTVPVGTFLRWLESEGKRVTMQSKVPRMLEDRAIADAILRYAEPGAHPSA